MSRIFVCISDFIVVLSFCSHFFLLPDFKKDTKDIRLNIQYLCACLSNFCRLPFESNVFVSGYYPPFDVFAERSCISLIDCVSRVVTVSRTCHKSGTLMHKTITVNRVSLFFLSCVLSRNRNHRRNRRQ